MIITIASYKGGVGKTMSAIHLAACFSKKGKTLLVDGDPNRTAFDWASQSSDVPFQFAVEDEDINLTDFPYVVIDTAARPSEEALQGLADISDLLVIPTATDAFSIAVMLKTINALQTLPIEKYRILLTIVPPRPSKDGDRARAVLTQEGIPLFKASIPRLVAFQKAALEGVPVYAVRDGNAETAWKAYQAVAKEILKK